MIEVLHKRDVPSQLWFQYVSFVKSTYTEVHWVVMMNSQIYSVHYTEEAADEVATDLWRYFS